MKKILHSRFKLTTNGLNVLLRAVYRWVSNFCCLVHNDKAVYVVQYIRGNQVTNLYHQHSCLQLTVISSDMELWHSRHMFTSSLRSPQHPAVVGGGEFCPSTPILIAEMEFDRLHDFHHSTCQHVLLYPSLPP